MMARAISLTLALALGLGACAGEDGDDKRIRSAVSDALTQPDPAACTELMTQRFVEQLEFARGRTAVIACRREIKREGPRRSLSVERVSRSGSRADAEVEPSSDNLPFTHLTIGLIKTDGDWKLDGFKRGTLGRGAFFRFGLGVLTRPPSALPVESAKCALREFKSVDDTTIERAFLNGDRRLFVFAGAICGLRSNGLSHRGVACVRGPLRRKFISGVIGRRLAKDPADVTGAIAADRTALRRLIVRCGGRGALRRS